MLPGELPLISPNKSLTMSFHSVRIIYWISYLLVDYRIV